jgi:hypothetical protein
MKADVELNLVHDGEQWIARGGELVAVGETLHDIDESVTDALRGSGDFPSGSSVTVFMGFDFDTIPTWLRQYHAHYFNRYITVNL